MNESQIIFVIGLTAGALLMYGGFMAGFFVKLYDMNKHEKRIRKELFEDIAKEEPYTMVTLETYQEAHKKGGD